MATNRWFEIVDGYADQVQITSCQLEPVNEIVNWLLVILFDKVQVRLTSVLPDFFKECFLEYIQVRFEMVPQIEKPMPSVALN